MTARWTASRIKESKGQAKLACLTAYDFATARIVDKAGMELILVGDSLGMVVLGYETTLPVTMDEMLHHTRAVVRGTSSALVVADMPFMSYQVSIEEAIRNAGRFIKEAGAGAVKIEGGASRVSVIRALVENGIPVLGHIGLTPQSIREMGGFKVQGRSPEQARRLLADAAAIQDAGVFAIVLECVPATVGAELTSTLRVPTIGIGAGPDCDGQILVCHDMLGLSGEKPLRFVKRYAELGSAAGTAFESYRNEVKNGSFPDQDHCYF